MTYKEALEFINGPFMVGYIPLSWPGSKGVPTDEELEQRREHNRKLDIARSIIVYFAFELGIENPAVVNRSNNEYMFYSKPTSRVKDLYDFYGGSWGSVDDPDEDRWRLLGGQPQVVYKVIKGVRVHITPTTLGRGLTWRVYGPTQEPTSYYGTPWEAVEAAEKYAEYFIKEQEKTRKLAEKERRAERRRERERKKQRERRKAERVEKVQQKIVDNFQEVGVRRFLSKKDEPTG